MFTFSKKIISCSRVILFIQYKINKYIILKLALYFYSESKNKNVVKFHVHVKKKHLHTILSNLQCSNIIQLQLK